MRELIITADDFGFSKAYNYGVIDAYENGVVTTLSLMVNMPATEHALNLWRNRCPEAPLILHCNFVQNVPISKPKDIPSLVDDNGNFYRSYQWRSDLPNNTKCIGNVYPTKDDFVKEIDAQLQEFNRLVGHYPIHFDAHSAMTIPMQQAFEYIGKKFGIHNPISQLNACNNMKEVFEFPNKDKQGTSIGDRGCLVNDWLDDNYGILEDSHDVAVIHFHPGYLDQYVLDNTSLTLPRCKDQSTLCDPKVREWIIGNNIKLVSFCDVL